MAETFGETSILDEAIMGANDRYGIKFTSGSAGTLASISVYIRYYNPANIKCALYDSSDNLVANGTTEEKASESGQNGWMVFAFSTPPSVDAASVYRLAWWVSDSCYIRYVSDPKQGKRMKATVAYGAWPDPLTGTLDKYRCSIYATYYEAPPPPAKTLVQAALISLAPLIAIPTLGQILKVAGG